MLPGDQVQEAEGSTSCQVGDDSEGVGEDLASLAGENMRSTEEP